MKKPILISTLLLFGSNGWTEVDLDNLNCDKWTATQTELNLCSLNDYNQIEKEMNQLIEEIKVLYPDDAQLIKNLDQKVWEEQCVRTEYDKAYPPFDEDGTEAHYGSIQPLRANNFWIEFAKARIEYFEKIKRDPRKGKIAFKCGTPLMEQRFFAGWIN